MSDTPRTDEIYGDRAHAERRVGHGAEELCRTLERENTTLRGALVRATGSLGLVIRGAKAEAPGHKENYDHARKVLEESESAADREEAHREEFHGRNFP